jgi:hypothetical protein
LAITHQAGQQPSHAAVHVGEVGVAWLVNLDGENVQARHEPSGDINAIYRLALRITADRSAGYKVPADPQLVATVGRNKKLCLLRPLNEPPAGGGSKAEIGFVEVERML